jgi:hypothetical protein
MSEASLYFATELLDQLGIGFVQIATSTEIDEKADLNPFNWWNELADGSQIERKEAEATSDFRNWLQKEWLDNMSPWSVELVIGESLPKVKANGKSSTGKTDLCVGLKLEMQTLTECQAELLPGAMGVVEIKRFSAKLKIPQMLLEVVALAKTSRYGKAVALLGTDGNNKWCLVHFAKHNEISFQYFRKGKKCLEEYGKMLSGISDRKEELAKATKSEEVSNKRPRLSCIPEARSPPRGNIEGPSLGLSAANVEQDLSGFEDIANCSRDKAIEDEYFLRRLADALGDLAGGSEHRPELPAWALAKNRIPSYYS